MKTRNRSHAPSRLLPGLENSAVWLVAIVGLSLSVAALMLIQQQLEAHKRLDFEWVAQNRIRALSHVLSSDMLAVTSLRDYVVAAGGVEAEGFRSFAESVLARHPGVESLMWVPGVEGAVGRPAAAGGGRPADGSGTAPSPRFPVAQMYPDRDGKISAGFDLGSVPGFAETLSRAATQGRVVASGRIALPGAQSGAGYGFMVASPVSRAGTARPNGFVVGFFSLEKLVNAAVSLLEPRGVEILILDESAPADTRFLHFYNSRLSPRVIGPGEYEAWWQDPQEPRIAQHVQVADRQLTIVCGRTPLFRSAEAFQEGPWVALVAGALFTVLLSFYLSRIKENIRQRAAMQRQLVEREELFRQMTETVDEAFWATAANGRELLYLSPAFGKILGISRGIEHPTLLDVAYPRDRKRLSEALKRTAKEGVGTEVIHRVQRTDGAMRWVRTRGFAVRDTHGRIYRCVGIMEDITERKMAEDALRESEAKLKDLFQHAPDVIMTVDVRGKILLMNRSIPELPAERAVGHSSLALMPRDFRQWFRKALQKVFQQSETRQFQYSADDGTYWEGRIVPICSDDGRVTAAMVIAGDVTEKRNLESQALRNARLASIGVLAAGVAHEINNPNNAIQFNASLASRIWQDSLPIMREYYEENGDFVLGGWSFSEAGESFPRLMSEIVNNSDRIRRIVTNLKHMSRQDTGELAEEVDVQQVLEATSMILHNQIQKYTDACTLEVPDGLPPVRGNSQQLEQVFINVLLNALQALPNRTAGVNVTAGLDADDGMVWVAFRDEGAGISERDLGRLMEPFFTTRTDAGGTGLGLSISRSIVDRHGGSMRIESELGSGTTVTIRIPAIRRE